MVSGFREALHPTAQANFERLLTSRAKALSFVGSQAAPALANLLLSRRDSLLAEVRSTVPAEELSLLWHAPLPTSTAIFPPTLLDTALNKARAASNDALVHKALHQPHIPKRQPQGNGRSSSSNRSADRSGNSPLTPSQQQVPRATNQSTLQQANRSNKNRGPRWPFSQSSGRPGNAGGTAKDPKSAQLDSTAPSSLVGGACRVTGTLARIPVLFPMYRPGSECALALLAEIEIMRSKGVLEVITEPDPGFYSRLFLVEKSSGGWRPVIDLSPLNEFVRQTPFRMETPSSVVLAVREGDFLSSIDLKDVYFQIPVHPSSGSSQTRSRPYTPPPVRVKRGLPGQGPVFRTVDPPQVFTRIFATVSAWAHSRGIRLLRYLGDWLVLSSSETKTRQHVTQLLSLCRSLGIVINMEFLF